MSLVTAKIEIQGLRPLLLHRFSHDALSIGKQERSGTAGNDPTEWRRSFLATPEGQLYLDPSYIFGCLRDGARYTKKGRASLQQPLSATLIVADHQILIDRYLPPNLEDITTNPTDPVYLDVRSVRNPATKGRNIRYRLALTPGWRTSFNIVWESTIVARDQMQQICLDAGALVGLGDGRSIGFGRFDLVGFQIFDVPKTGIA